MPDQPKTQAPDDSASLIDFSDIAKTDRPEAPSLARERAERDRARRAENDAAATAGDGETRDPIAPNPD